MPQLLHLTIRLTHTGLYADGRPNTSYGVLIDDINQGEMQQHRKHAVYVPANGAVELPLTDQVLFSYTQGAIHTLIMSGQLTAEVPISTSLESTIGWSFETSTSLDYVGGFYDFASTDNDFSPSVFFGAINASVAAHFMIVTGALTVDEVTITITGDCITDSGVQVGGDSQDIVIPAGTPVNSYFETSKKWNGQVTVETTSGTAVTCNFGWCKYWDHNNRNFDILGLEVLWSSQSNDSTSNVCLIHHKSAGWTFNGGSTPTHPPALADRAADHGLNVAHVDGKQGAWKRDNIFHPVLGGDSEGILWQINSGSTGVGSASFREMDLLLTVFECPLGRCSF